MADQHTYERDPMVGEVRFRLPLPVVVPIGALLTIGILVFGFSRVLLAVPREAAVLIAVVMAANILAACAVLALRPQMSGATMAELAAVVLYPVIIGVALAAFGIGQGEATKETGEGEQAPAGGITESVSASGVAFDTDTIVLPADEEATLEFENADTVQHNIHILTAQGGESLFEGQIIGTETTTYTIDPLEPGEYFFQCDVHPDSMTGTVEVK